MSDEPVPQCKPDIDGFGGEVLRLMVNLNNRIYQRLEVIECRRVGMFLFSGHSRLISS